MGISSIIFLIALTTGGFFFVKRIALIKYYINLGKDQVINDRKGERWGNMARVAMGQSKMVRRPVAGFLHILVYVGFIIVNIEVLEIIIDGVFGTHRVFAGFFPSGLYNFLIASFEILAFLVFTSCVIFLIRRNVMRIKRFLSPEMKGWPKSDANLILIFEILLMSAFLKMNAMDQVLQDMGAEHYVVAGTYPISQYLKVFFQNFEMETLIVMERIAWWFHIIGILIFAVYVTYSKHLHIFLAFPNTWYARLNNPGELNNLESVKNEVEKMMDPSIDPYATPPEGAEAEVAPTFGAKDVTDLSWKNVMDAFTCTECGRCTSVCPANQTGKLLSPRKIMMDTRDRAQELGDFKKKNGDAEHDGKSLLRDYIKEEEIWACTSCNACVDICPIMINPLDIIIDVRRNLIMEESKSPESITSMFNNIENNGAPWAFSPSDRDKWKEELN
ncbi:MAG: heterodisulfide reductase subunit C [Flavobacteriales bacterium]|jgi:heterodisulfide reductase subunit C